MEPTPQHSRRRRRSDFLVAVLYKLAAPRRWWWRLNIHLQAFIHGGVVDIQGPVQITHPVKFQGGGTLVIEEGVVLGAWMSGASKTPILLQPRTPEARISIGSKTAIANGCEMIARQSIHIGRHCRVGARTVIVDSDFHGLRPDERHLPGRTEPVVIGDNVWLGNEVAILKGVHIGDDAIVGMRCVVTKDIPPGGIAAGNPMRIIGSVYA